MHIGFFSSISGHGTFMAKSILQVRPFADIVPYRLKTTLDATSMLPWLAFDAILHIGEVQTL
jgi:hypothetical protein